MIIKFLITFFLLLNLAPVDACSLNLFSKIYRFTPGQSLKSNDIVFKSDCGPNVVNKISEMVSGFSGTIGTEFIKREIKTNDGLASIEIIPRKISLLDFSETLKDQLSNKTNFYFKNIKSLNGLNTIALLENEQLKAVCENCSSLGEKNIQIDISNPLLNTFRTLWFSSSVMAKINVFKAKRNLSFQQKNLEPADFYGDETLTNFPENLLTSLENIQFYKANKTILQGATILNTDLRPVNLVNYGTPVNVILKNKNIFLQKMATPSRSALFGETIELKSSNNNKSIVGKVVDYNKVVIEL